MITFLFKFAFAATTALLVSACGQPASTDSSYSGDGENELMSPILPPTNEGEPFTVESDPRANYRLLRWTRMRNGNIEAVTRRDGPSGTSFARREIDCRTRLFRYLGEGDALDDALKDSKNIGEMTDLVSGSIADVTVTVTCARATK